MRNTWNHVAPDGHRECPPDNTSRYVYEQCRAWCDDIGRVIHPEVAMEAAAWWHSPGADSEAITAFASTGTIIDGLQEEISRERRAVADAMPDLHDGRSTIVGPIADAWQSLVVLDALRAYVRAVPVTVYTVSKNIAGYLPESDPDYRGLDYREAVQAYRGMLDSAPEEVAREDECECTTEFITDGETCELCTVDALVKCHIKDDTHQSDGTPLGLVIPADSWAGSMSYWLHWRTMAYGEFEDSQEV